MGRGDALVPRVHWGGIGYSLRRYYIDEFQTRQIARLPSRSQVLDLGGTRILKRGQFDIGRYDMQVVYANLSTSKRPDVQADAANVPFRDSCFDAVICSELLEHVPAPLAVLGEVHRVLKVGGRVLISVPFLYPIHADPYDYGRYTDTYWVKELDRIGFTILALEKQGLYWSVLVDLLRAFASDGLPTGRVASGLVRRVLLPFIRLAKRAAVKWESRPKVREKPFVSSFTTGFGIVAIKRSG